MSKQKLVTLIVMMALVMTGLILVQINSIQKSARIREEQFDQTVRQILSQVVLKMEEHERVCSWRRSYMLRGVRTPHCFLCPLSAISFPGAFRRPI